MISRGWSCGLAAMLAGCTAGPDYRPPALATPTGSVPTLVEADAPAFAVEEPPADWWRLYESPDLDALVEKALRRNTDLRMALANLEAADAALRSAELRRTVQTGFAAAATYGQASADQRGAPSALSPGPIFNWDAAVSYDFDLFGRIKRGIEESAADSDGARAALDLARINVVASVAGAYAAICAAGNQIAVTNRSIALARNIAVVTERRVQGGISGVNDKVRARALLAQTIANLPGYVAKQRAGLFLLATLTGDPPDQFPGSVANCVSPPVLRAPIPVGDGASLLKRRPDIRAAERRLAASVARIGIATGELYPSVTFGGRTGIFATRAGDLASNRAFSWGLGPLVQWTFPNVATARAGIAKASAYAKADLAAFDGTVLLALREVDTNLSALARQLEAETSLRDARDQAAAAARNTERLYRGGVGQFIDTLDAERTLIQSDAALAQASAEVADLQVRLFLALGGGWQNAPIPEPISLEPVIANRP